MTSQSSIPPSALNVRTEAYKWIVAEAAITGNIFARYVHAWLRSDRAQAINPSARAWLVGISQLPAKIKASWATALLSEIDGVGLYSEVAL